MTAAFEPAIERAAVADRPIVHSLLVEARLPVQDLDLATHVIFWVTRDAYGCPVGAIGLERHGNVGLVRSLVVAPGQRLHGLGRALVRALEEHANAAGLAQLVLLTETAEAFFHRLGYAAIDRDRAPPAVISSAEFRTLCPATALCMTKRLSPPH